MADFTYRNPGDALTHTALNEPFANASTALGAGALDQHAFADESVGLEQLSDEAIDFEPVSVVNSSTTATSYSGTSYTDVTHGTALAWSPSTAPDFDEGEVIRVAWSQFISHWVDNGGTLSVSNGCKFKVQWNIGAGFVDAPFMTEGIYRAASARSSLSTGDVDQRTRHAAGEGIYIVPSGGVTVSGIKLLVQPSINAAGDEVYLGNGTLSVLVTRR